MALVALKSGGRQFYFFAHGEEAGGKVAEGAAKAVTTALPPGEAGALADALLPAFLTHLETEPKRAFVCVDGAMAFHLGRLQGFKSKDVGAGDILVDGALALPHPIIARGAALCGRRSCLPSEGAADHVVVGARSATDAMAYGQAICAAVPETKTYEAEETWNALMPAARLASALKSEGKIYGAAITHKGRGRTLGAMDPNPLFRLRVSDWR